MTWKLDAVGKNFNTAVILENDVKLKARKKAIMHHGRDSMSTSLESKPHPAFDHSDRIILLRSAWYLAWIAAKK